MDGKEISTTSLTLGYILITLIVIAIILSGLGFIKYFRYNLNKDETLEGFTSEYSDKLPITENTIHKQQDQEQNQIQSDTLDETTVDTKDNKEDGLPERTPLQGS